MLTELQIGKEYHVKPYRTLVQEFSKYWQRCTPDTKHLDRLRYIANKTIIIDQVSSYTITFSYNKQQKRYGFVNNNSWVIYPHELIEFDDINNNLNIF